MIWLEKSNQDGFKSKVNENLEFFKLAILILNVHERSKYINIIWNWSWTTLNRLLDLGSYNELTYHLSRSMIQIIGSCHRVDSCEVANRLDDIYWGTLIFRFIFINALQTAGVFVLQTFEKTTYLIDWNWSFTIDTSSHRGCAYKITVKILDLKVWQTWTNKVVFMEYCCVFNNTFKFN